MMEGAHMARFAQRTSVVSSMASCRVQFTKSFEEKQSKRTCLSNSSLSVGYIQYVSP